MAKCEDRIDQELESTIATLDELWNLYLEDAEGYTEDGERFIDHGLAFDYVAPGTFGDQDEGYWRYQLSWGRLSDEFRFYSSGPAWRPHRIEYWFLDWGDGAERHLRGSDLALLVDIWDYFADCGVVDAEYQKALEY